MLYLALCPVITIAQKRKGGPIFILFSNFQFVKFSFSYFLISLQPVFMHLTLRRVPAKGVSPEMEMWLGRPSTSELYYTRVTGLPNDQPAAGCLKWWVVLKLKETGGPGYSLLCSEWEAIGIQPMTKFQAILSKWGCLEISSPAPTVCRAWCHHSQ